MKNFRILFGFQAMNLADFSIRIGALLRCIILGRLCELIYRQLAKLLLQSSTIARNLRGLLILLRLFLSGRTQKNRR